MSSASSGRKQIASFCQKIETNHDALIWNCSSMNLKNDQEQLAAGLELVPINTVLSRSVASSVRRTLTPHIPEFFPISR